MRSKHLCAAMPVALFLILALASQARSQDDSERQSDLEILQQAELSIERLRARSVFDESNLSLLAWRQLTGILQRNPNSEFRSRIELDMLPLEEILGNHDLELANFFLQRGHGTKGAQGRLLKIVESYPGFSRMDDVLFDLATISLRDHDPDTARDYLLKVICRYPSSSRVISAFNGLNDIGFGVWNGCEKFKP